MSSSHRHGKKWRGMTLYQRIWSHTVVQGGCIEWAGITRGGYGRLYFDGARRSAHRVAYEMVIGPIPDGTELDHLCRNRRCMNPAHLEPVSHKVNVQRGSLGGRVRCLRGHPFDHINTYVDPNGNRECRACVRERSRSYRRRQKEKAA